MKYMAAASWSYKELEHDLFKYVDIDPSLNGSDLGQIVFDKNTQMLSQVFSCEGVKIFTGIGYVVTQAIEHLPSELVPGTYHPEYNPNPATGPKKKIYIGKYKLDDYFSSREFTKYPDCTHIIIVDWNKKSIQMIMDIIESVPHIFAGKHITIVHGDIKSPITIRIMREIAERDYSLPITGIYVTNIVDTFTPEDIALFSELSSGNVQLRCDTMRTQGFEQMIVNTVGDHEPIYITNTPERALLRQQRAERTERNTLPAPYGGTRKTKRSKTKSFHKLYAKCMLYNRLKHKTKLSTPRFTISSASSPSRPSTTRKYRRGRTH